MFAEGCGCGAGPAWPSRGRPTTWPGGARGLGRKGSGGGPVLGDRRWAVGRWAKGRTQNRGRCLWGKVPSLAKVAAQRLPLRLLALFSSSAPEMVLAFLGVYSCFVGAGYPPPLQTIFFSCYTFFPPDNGGTRILDLFSLWYFRGRGCDARQLGDIPILQIGN